MISLNIQIKLLIFSFIYGFLFSIMLDIFYEKVKSLKMIYSILLSFILVLIMTLVYFVGISHIGYLLFHFYSILAIIFGFLSYDVIIKMIANRYKK